jgi:hypothetical protein
MSGLVRNTTSSGTPGLAHRVWHTSLAAPFGVFAPDFRQVEFVGDGEAGGYRADGQADGDRAVVLFADLAAVLPGDADGVFAFLSKKRRYRRPPRRRGAPGRSSAAGRRGGMSAPDIIGFETGGHGFPAFAFSGQEEAEAVAG